MFSSSPHFGLSLTLIARQGLPSFKRPILLKFLEEPRVLSLVEVYLPFSASFPHPSPCLESSLTSTRSPSFQRSPPADRLSVHSRYIFLHLHPSLPFTSSLTLTCHSDLSSSSDHQRLPITELSILSRYASTLLCLAPPSRRAPTFYSHLEPSRSYIVPSFIDRIR